MPAAGPADEPADEPDEDEDATSPALIDSRMGECGAAATLLRGKSPALGELTVIGRKGELGAGGGACEVEVRGANGDVGGAGAGAGVELGGGAGAARGTAREAVLALVDAVG